MRWRICRTTLRKAACCMYFRCLNCNRFPMWGRPLVAGGRPRSPVEFGECNRGANFTVQSASAHQLFRAAGPSLQLRTTDQSGDDGIANVAFMLPKRAGRGCLTFVLMTFLSLGAVKAEGVLRVCADP